MHEDIEAHAARLESIAAGMLEAGLGAHPTKGHAVLLKLMAHDMRAAVANGEVVHEYNTAPWTGLPTPRPSAMAAAALAKTGIEVTGEKIPLGKLNEVLAKSGMSIAQRFQLKGASRHMQAC